MLVRSSGTMTQVRAVLLECGHEFIHPNKNAGEEIACRECRPKRVYRSHLNEHTISPWRTVVEVIYV